MSVCGQSYGSQAKGWTWCVLPAKHAGSCQDWLGRAFTEGSWDADLEAQAFVAKQIAVEWRKLGIDTLGDMGQTP